MLVTPKQKFLALMASYDTRISYSRTNLICLLISSLNNVRQFLLLLHHELFLHCVWLCTDLCPPHFLLPIIKMANLRVDAHGIYPPCRISPAYFACVWVALCPPSLTNPSRVVDFSVSLFPLVRMERQLLSSSHAWNQSTWVVVFSYFWFTGPVFYLSP